MTFLYKHLKSVQTGSVGRVTAWVVPGSFADAYVIASLEPGRSSSFDCRLHSNCQLPEFSLP